MKTMMTALCLSAALAGSALAQSNSNESYSDTSRQLSNIEMNTIQVLEKHGVTQAQVAQLTVSDMVSIYMFLGDDSLDDSAKKYHIKNIFARHGM